MEPDIVTNQLSFEEIDDKLKQPREKILQVFVSRDGEVFTTSTLREASGVSTGSIKHHLETLQEWDILRELDERQYTEHGGGSKSRQWTLTDRGERFVEDYIEYVPPADLEELAKRIVEIEKELDALREDHEDDIEDVEERVSEGVEQIEGLKSMFSPDANGQR